MHLQRRGTGNKVGRISNNDFEHTAALEIEHLLTEEEWLFDEYSKASSESKPLTKLRLDQIHEAIGATYKSYKEAGFINSKELKEEIEWAIKKVTEPTITREKERQYENFLLENEEVYSDGKLLSKFKHKVKKGKKQFFAILDYAKEKFTASK